MEKSFKINATEKELASLKKELSKSKEMFNEGWKLSEERGELPKKCNSDFADGYRSREFFFLKKEVSELKNFIINMSKDNNAFSDIVDLKEFEKTKSENLKLLQQISFLSNEIVEYKKSRDEWFLSTSQMYKEFEELRNSNNVLSSEVIELRKNLEVFERLLEVFANSMEFLRYMVRNMGKTMDIDAISNVTGVSVSVVTLLLGERK